MPDARKSREGEHSILAQIIAIRLQQLEAQSPNAEGFIEKLGIGRGTYFDLVRGRGNPTLRTIEKVAARLDQPLFELVGLTNAEVRRATKRVGIDYDELKAALAERKTADSKIAAAMTPMK
ncbi:MAG: helix-turn-helix domain-containing protein [Bosea sp. (in: a-proteobacteria)]